MVATCPAQMTVLLGVIVREGTGLTDIACDAVLVHPEAAVVPVTVYVVLEPGFTVYAAVAGPEVHT